MNRNELNRIPMDIDEDDSEPEGKGRNRELRIHLWDGDRTMCGKKYDEFGDHCSTDIEEVSCKLCKKIWFYTKKKYEQEWNKDKRQGEREKYLKQKRKEEAQKLKQEMEWRKELAREAREEFKKGSPLKGEWWRRH